MKFYVEHKGKVKKVTAERACVHDDIQAKYGLRSGSYTLEYRDKDCSGHYLWVEVDDINDIEDGGCVRLTSQSEEMLPAATPTVPATSTSPSTPSTSAMTDSPIGVSPVQRADTVIVFEPADGTESQWPCLQEGRATLQEELLTDVSCAGDGDHSSRSTNAPSDQPVESRATTQPGSTSGVQVTANQNRATGLQVTRYLNPNHLAQNLCNNLQKTSYHIQTSDWTDIMSEMFASYTSQTKSWEPSSAQYDEMASSVYEVFPLIRGKMAWNDALRLAKRKLRDKFKNKRREKRVAETLEGPSPRRAEGAEETAVPTKRPRVAGLPKYGAQNTLTGIQTQRKINELKSENLSETEVSELMDATFADRRSKVMNPTEGEDAFTLIERDYPRLFCNEEFQREVTRLAEDNHFFEKAHQAVQEKLAEFQEILKSQPEDTLRQVAALLGVNLAALVQCEGAERGCLPGLYGKTVAQLNRELYVASTETEALTALVLSHSVYNVKFPKNTRNILYFLQKYVIGIDDGTKPPPKVISFVSKL